MQFPTFSGFGRCEFPHPSEHGHSFDYINAIDCIKNEMEPTISALFAPLNLNTNSSQQNNTEKTVLKISPNPFNSNAVITFGSLVDEIGDQQALLTIQDITGAFSKTLWQGNITSFVQQVLNINGTELNGYGTYIVTFSLINLT